MRLTFVEAPVSRTLSIRRCGSTIRNGNTFFTVLALAAAESGKKAELFNLCLADALLPKEASQVLSFLQAGDQAEFEWKLTDNGVCLVRAQLHEFESLQQALKGPPAN